MQHFPSLGLKMAIQFLWKLISMFCYTNTNYIRSGYDHDNFPYLHWDDGFKEQGADGWFPGLQQLSSEQSS